MFGMFSDFASKAKQRQEMKQEVDRMLTSEQTTLQDIFGLNE
jgi:hypothetical protein